MLSGFRISVVFVLFFPCQPYAIPWILGKNRFCFLACFSTFPGIWSFGKGNQERNRTGTQHCFSPSLHATNPTTLPRPSQQVCFLPVLFFLVLFFLLVPLNYGNRTRGEGSQIRCFFSYFFLFFLIFSASPLPGSQRGRKDKTRKNPRLAFLFSFSQARRRTYWRAHRTSPRLPTRLDHDYFLLSRGWTGREGDGRRKGSLSRMTVGLHGCLLPRKGWPSLHLHLA